MNPNTIVQDISDRCNDIYLKLGSSHNECVYQKALVIELYNMKATSVEYEKSVPVFFEDNNGVEHTIGSERVDILARFDSNVVLIELKATTSLIRENVEGEQLKKYERALRKLNIHCDCMMVINFTQQKDISYITSQGVSVMVF